MLRKLTIIYQFVTSYSFIRFELPSNLVLKRFKPPRWIFFLMVSWGILQMCDYHRISSMSLIVSFGTLQIHGSSDQPPRLLRDQIPPRNVRGEIPSTYMLDDAMSSE